MIGGEISYCFIHEPLSKDSACIFVDHVGYHERDEENNMLVSITTIRNTSSQSSPPPFFDLIQYSYRIVSTVGRLLDQRFEYWEL